MPCINETEWTHCNGRNIGDQAAGSCWVVVGPLHRVQAVLTEAAELGTEFVSRGS